jgi:hypothetical protein
VSLLSPCAPCAAAHTDMVDLKRLSLCFAAGHILIDSSGDPPRPCKKCKSNGREVPIAKPCIPKPQTCQTPSSEFSLDPRPNGREVMICYLHAVPPPPAH